MISAPSLLLALLFVSSCEAATSPCDIGLAETSLLLRAIDFLKQQQNSIGICQALVDDSRPQPQTVKVSITTGTQGSVYIMYPSGIQALVFNGDSTDAPELQVLGNVPPPCQVPVSTWRFIEHALLWVTADVTFNATSQQAILVSSAHCFGAEGRDAIVAGNVELSKSVAFGVPHMIQLDPMHSMIIWDFDVIDRMTCMVTGRGTDFVHFCPDGHVYQVDTIRHQGHQPDWAKQQIQHPANASNACQSHTANPINRPIE
jgi:hypothetical protein